MQAPRAGKPVGSYPHVNRSDSYARDRTSRSLISSCIFLSVTNVILGLAFGSIVLIFILGKRSPVLNSIFLLLPIFTSTIYPGLLGETILEISTQGSVGDRLRYLAIIVGPFVMGVIGTLNIKIDGSAKATETKSDSIITGAILLIFPILELFSIFSLKPVNGIGQSIYVPFATAIISMFLVLFIALDQIDIDSFRAAAEYLLICTFLFLLINQLVRGITWPSQISSLYASEEQSLRFSPFASILNLESRQGYFESDAQRFAMFALLSFAVLWTSNSVTRRITGCAIVFMLGSTTQSRLFYIGVIAIVITQLLRKISPSWGLLPRIVYLLFIFFTYVFTLSEAGNIGNDEISTLSARTYIWGITLDHWNDASTLFAHSGAYSLASFSKENSTLFLIYHAHSMVLQLLWDWGIFGLITGFIVIFLICKAYLFIPWPGFVIGTIILIQGLVEPVLYFNVTSTQLLFLLIYVKYIYASKHTESESVP